MAKTIDLSQKLDNSRPFIKVAEGKIFEVDNRKNTVLKLSKQMESAGDGDLSAIDDVIKGLLGKEAAKEIEAMDLPIPAYENLIIGLMAAVSDEPFEAVDARFQRDKRQQ